MKYATLEILSAALASAQGRPPGLLVDALRRLPGLTILDPAIDLVGAPEFDVVKKYAVRSWVEADFDHDGAPDVAAAVVSRANGTRFGVWAVLSSRPARVFWIVPLGDLLYGVDFGHDLVAPVYCIECDNYQSFRWSGRAFVAKLWTASDPIGVVGQDLLAEPREGAGIVVKSGPCLSAKVVDFRGADVDARWYLVETLGGKSKRGWVPEKAVYPRTGSTCVTEQ